MRVSHEMEPSPSGGVCGKRKQTPGGWASRFADSWRVTSHASLRARANCHAFRSPPLSHPSTPSTSPPPPAPLLVDVQMGIDSQARQHLSSCYLPFCLSPTGAAKAGRGVFVVKTPRPADIASLAPRVTSLRKLPPPGVINRSGGRTFGNRKNVTADE